MALAGLGRTGPKRAQGSEILCQPKPNQPVAWKGGMRRVGRAKRRAGVIRFPASATTAAGDGSLLQRTAKNPHARRSTHHSSDESAIRTRYASRPERLADPHGRPPIFSDALLKGPRRSGRRADRITLHLGLGTSGPVEDEDLHGLWSFTVKMVEVSPKPEAVRLPRGDGEVMRDRHHQRAQPRKGSTAPWRVLLTLFFTMGPVYPM